MNDDEIISQLIADGATDEQIKAAFARVDAAPAQAPVTAAPAAIAAPAEPVREVAQAPVADDRGLAERALNAVGGKKVEPKSFTDALAGALIQGPQDAFKATTTAAGNLLEGAGSALDFLGGITRTGAANVADSVLGTETATGQDFIDAIVPFDGKPAPTGAELVRRATGEEERKGLQLSDGIGFGVDLITDPLSFISRPVKAANKTLNAAKAINFSGEALRKGIAGTLEQATRLSGNILTNQGDDIVKNFMTNPKKFVELAKDDDAVTGIFTNIVDKIDVAAQATKAELSKRFEKVLDTRGQVDISSQKKAIESLAKKFPVRGDLNDAALATAQEVQEITRRLLGTTAADGSFKTIGNKVSARDANLFKESFADFTSLGPDATSAQKQVAKVLQNASTNLNQDIFGKKLLKEYQEKVINRGKQVERFFGEGTDVSSRALKAQTTLKSGTRSDNFALRSLLKKVNKDLGPDVDILKDGIDVRTLGLASDSVGRLISGGFGGAINAFGEIGFKGAARANDAARKIISNNGGLTQDAIEELIRNGATPAAIEELTKRGFTQGSIDNITRRALTEGLRD